MSDAEREVEALRRTVEALRETVSRRTDPPREKRTGAPRDPAPASSANTVPPGMDSRRGSERARATLRSRREAETDGGRPRPQRRRRHAPQGRQGAPRPRAYVGSLSEDQIAALAMGEDGTPAEVRALASAEEYGLDVRDARRAAREERQRAEDRRRRAEARTKAQARARAVADGGQRSGVSKKAVGAAILGGLALLSGGGA